MNYFSSDKFTGPKTREDRRCTCGLNPSSRIACWTLCAASPSVCSNASAANAVGPRTKSKAASVGDLFHALVHIPDPQ